MRRVPLIVLLLTACCQHGAQTTEDEYVTWLRDHSMLKEATALDREVSGKGMQWRRPYSQPQPRAASARASVWFTAYPAAMITKPGTSVIAALGSPELWRRFQEIGIRGMHTGPMKRAGGVRGREYTPTIDGNFDRISMEIDPAFGTEAEYLALTRTARDNGGIAIGDIIPGHTGKGSDFRLAELGYGEYPGLYHMVEIAAKDWGVMPAVPEGKDEVNLPPAAVDRLRQLGYLVGQLPRTMLFEPGVKETDWSATPVVRGVDGKERRWVYLHYFKAGQPTLNWLDPSFSAQRLVLGDALHSLLKLGENMLRLDANGFLGIERRTDERAWSEGHPLSVTSNQLIAGLVRKLGGFTFQELNLTLDDIRNMSQGGADLSYDFVTRPAYHHALVTGDASFLKLMLAQMHEFKIDPAGLIHALQNHDELTIELVHFWTTHAKDTFTFRGKQMSGSELRDTIRAEMHVKLTGEAAPYNLKFSNGIASTTATVAAAALGIRDITKLTDEQRRQIQQAHLLLAMFNAFQPGVFALSGWDLVGALTLPGDSVKALLADGDTRWINRGAYDLLGANPTAKTSGSGLPRATALYGSLPDQLARPDSFASQLKKLLDLRQKYRVYEARQVELPEVKAPGLVVMVQKLPEHLGAEITVLNFGSEPVEEEVILQRILKGRVTDLVADQALGQLEGGRLNVKLGPREGKILHVAGKCACGH